MSKFVLLILLLVAPLMKADSIEIPNPQKVYSQAPPRPSNQAQTTGNVNIEQCILSVAMLKPMLNRLILDADVMPSQDQIVKDFKVISAQLQQTASSCGITFTDVAGAGNAANCETDIHVVLGLIQGLDDDGNYMMLMGSLMTLGQLLPQAVADCSA
jgi:hypothetical protein